MNIKSDISYLFILFVGIGYISAQPTPVNQRCFEKRGIYTALPINGQQQPGPVNPTNPAMTNIGQWSFNWRGDQVPGDLCNMPGVYSSWSNPNDPTPSPFLGNNSFHPASDFLTIQQDYNPEDGWELIQRGFGKYLDGTNTNQVMNGSSSCNPNVHQQQLPYFILYNRYTSALMVFGCTNLSSSIQRIRLRFTTRDEYGVLRRDFGEQDGTRGDGVGPVAGASNQERNEYKYSALLSQSGGTAQPLDQKTKVTSVSAYARPTNLQNTWFVGIFRMAYDPCVCNNYQSLEVIFENVATGEISLQGRFAGTSVPLVKADATKFVDPLFWANTTDEEGVGALVASDATSAWKKFEAEEKAKGNFSFAKAFSYLGKASGLASELGCKKCKIAKAAFEVVGASFEIGAIPGEKKDKPSYPPYIMRGEMKLNGRVTTAFPQQVADICVPGSKDSDLRNEKRLIVNCRTLPTGQLEPINSPRPVPIAPFYNEVLGTFAMLETPKIEGYHGFITRFALKENLKFAFNPAAEVDMAKTSIKACYVVTSLQDNGLATNIQGNSLTNNLTFSQLSPRTYATPFVPLECLRSYVTCAFSNQFRCIDTDKVSLKVMIDYTFLPNRYGKVISLQEVLTFPVNFTSTTNTDYLVALSVLTGAAGPLPLKPLSPGIPGMYTIGVEYEEEDNNGNIIFTSPPTQTHFTQNTTIRAWNLVEINRPITLAPGVRLTIISGGTIEVSPDVVLPPGVELVIDKYFIPCNWSTASQDGSYVSDFCGGTSYQADDCSNCLVAPAPIDSTEQEIPLPKFGLTAAPNPFNEGGVRIDFGLEQAGRCMVTVHDMLGKQVAVLLSTDTAAEGPQQLFWDAADAPMGIYIVTLYTEQGPQSIKVSKQ